MIFWDSENRWADGNNPYARDAVQYVAGNAAYGARHSEMHNVAYLDGHVKSVRFNQMKLGNFFNFADADARNIVPVTQAWPWAATRLTYHRKGGRAPDAPFPLSLRREVLLFPSGLGDQGLRTGEKLVLQLLQVGLGTEVFVEGLERA